MLDRRCWLLRSENVSNVEFIISLAVTKTSLLSFAEAGHATKYWALLDELTWPGWQRFWVGADTTYFTVNSVRYQPLTVAVEGLIYNLFCLVKSQFNLSWFNRRVLISSGIIHNSNSRQERLRKIFMMLWLQKIKDPMATVTKHEFWKGFGSIYVA